MADTDLLGLIPAKTSIAVTGTDPVFDCYIRPEVRWNGFLCPLFTKAEAERVVQWINDGERWSEDGVRAVWLDDVTILVVDTGGGEDEKYAAAMYPPDAFDPRHRPEGPIDLYAIGYQNWTWEDRK